MKTRRIYTVPTRDTTIGHWRFRGSLSDGSGQSNHLTGQNITAEAFAIGWTEEGVTAVQADATNSPARKAFVPAASAAAFDFASQSFTIEIIFRDTVESSGTNLLQKRSGNLGYQMEIVGSSGEDHYLWCYVGDGTHWSYRQATLPITTGKWHYAALVVDRTASQLRIYLDGAAAGSFSISSVSGSIGNAAQDFIVQTSNGGTVIDEICVSLEVLTAAAIAERAAGETEDVAGDDAFLLGFLPEINRDSADLQQFLIPATRQYLGLKDLGQEALDLIAWDRTPERYLTHLASLFGFELIDAPFATAAERRSYLPWIAWIYQRKGTVAAITKLIELLGFSASLTEVFPDATPFVANFHRCWSRDQVKRSELTDDFATLAAWDYPLAYDSRWQIVSGKLRGIGNGSDSPLNAITIASALSVYRLEAKYAIVSGTSAPDKLGFYLKWIDADNHVALVLNLTAGGDTLAIERRESGSPSSTVLVTVSNVLASSAYRTGEHRLWIFADHATGRFTGGIDDRTLFFDTAISMANPAATKKGLLINKSLVVDWDDWSLQELNDSQSARTWTDAFTSRTLRIALTGSPAFATSKANYLKQILPAYVPAGTELEFL